MCWFRPVFAVALDCAATRAGETRRLLLRDNDPAKPTPEEAFAGHRTLGIGGERIQLLW
jgi:hypothetical protein